MFFTFPKKLLRRVRESKNRQKELKRIRRGRQYVTFNGDPDHHGFALKDLVCPNCLVEHKYMSTYESDFLLTKGCVKTYDVPIVCRQCGLYLLVRFSHPITGCIKDHQTGKWFKRNDVVGEKLIEVDIFKLSFTSYTPIIFFCG